MGTMANLNAIARALALAGGLGTVSMVMYTVALRYVDRTLIPAAARPRVRWWSENAKAVLRVSVFLTALGLALLGFARLAGS